MRISTICRSLQACSILDTLERETPILAAISPWERSS